MADQGLLGQSKPAGTTNTVLYAAPMICQPKQH